MDPIKLLQGVLAGGIMFILFELLLMVVYITFWMIALIHCIRHQPEKDRTMWVLIIILVPLFGMILYHSIGKQPSVPASPVASPPVISMRYASGAVNFKPDPAFDLSAMQDERKRADAINDALRAESQRNRQRPS